MSMFINVYVKEPRGKKDLRIQKNSTFFFSYVILGQIFYSLFSNIKERNFGIFYPCVLVERSNMAYEKKIK